MSASGRQVIATSGAPAAIGPYSQAVCICIPCMISSTLFHTTPKTDSRGLATFRRKIRQRTPLFT